MFVKKIYIYIFGQNLRQAALKALIMHRDTSSLCFYWDINCVLSCKRNVKHKDDEESIVCVYKLLSSTGRTLTNKVVSRDILCLKACNAFADLIWRLSCDHNPHHGEPIRRRTPETFGNVKHVRLYCDRSVNQNAMYSRLFLGL